MLHVMLVDDDVMIRDYLRDVIRWKELNLSFSCEAGDSETARELFLLHQPEIVITDINIPIISGLELAKEFIAQNGDVRIIVITGYGYFEDVRDSVSLGAVDLLSKPITPEEINESLRKAADHFAQRKRRYHTERALGELLAENRDMLQERCVAHLMVRPPEGGEEQIRKQFELLSLSFPGDSYAAVHIRLGSEHSGDMGGAAFPTAFKKLCDTAFATNGFRVFSYYETDSVLRLLVNWSGEHGDERIESLLAKLLAETQAYFQTGFVSSIGSVVHKLSDLWRSSETASLAERFLDDSFRGVSNYKNIGILAVSDLPYNRDVTERLLEYARSFRKNEFQLLLSGTISTLSLEDSRNFALEFLSRLGAECLASGVYPWTAVNYPETVAGIFRTQTPSSVRQILGSTSATLMDALYRKKADSKNRLIQKAKEYIRDNLSDPELSLDTVSSHIGLSKNYFCQLFHQEENISFNAYVNTVRIDTAKKLLSDSQKKIYEISEICGYRNQKYFNYVFKHATGLPPMEYRNRSS